MEKPQRSVGGAKNAWRQRGCRAEACDGMVFDHDESQNKRFTTCETGAADNTYGPNARPLTTVNLGTDNDQPEIGAAAIAGTTS